MRPRVALLPALAALAGCKGGADAAKAPPQIEVDVVKVARQPVAIYEEYGAQTQAANTIELRARATGLLRIGGQHAVIAVAVDARGRDERGQAIDQLQRRQAQLGAPIGLGCR